MKEQAVAAMNRTSVNDKLSFDNGKAKVQLFKVDDLVLLKNEERNLTDVDQNYKDLL